MVDACTVLLRDTLAPAASGVKVDASFPGGEGRASVALLLSQLDRPQIVSVATLQLLQHAATGRCAPLRILHADDWPELRLESVRAPQPHATHLRNAPTAVAGRICAREHASKPEHASHALRKSLSLQALGAAALET